jgi:hypothetical protein
MCGCDDLAQQRPGTATTWHSRKQLCSDLLIKFCTVAAGSRFYSRLPASLTHIKFH